MCKDIKPIKKEIIVANIVSFGKVEEPIVMIFAPKIIGIDIRNENFNAVFSFNPANIPVEIVVPDLDIPGNKANTCAIPIIIAFFLFSL